MEYLILYNPCLTADVGEDTEYIIIDSSSSSDEDPPETKKPKVVSPTELNDSERTYRQWNRDRAANPVHWEDEARAEDATMYVEDEARAGDPEPMYTKGGKGKPPTEEEVSSSDLDAGDPIFTRKTLSTEKQKKLTKTRNAEQRRAHHVEEAQKLVVKIGRHELTPKVEKLKKSFEPFKGHNNPWFDLSMSVVEVCPEFKEMWSEDFDEAFTDDVLEVLLDSVGLYPDMPIDELRFKCYRFVFAVVAYCSEKHGTQAEVVLSKMFQFVVERNVVWRSQKLIDMFEKLTE